METQKEFLTEKGKENLRTTKEQIARNEEYISFEEAEERDLHFNAEQIKPVPGKFGGTRFECIVTDLTNFPDMEKKWTVSKTAAKTILKQLEVGNTILHVKAEGEGIARRYQISPTKQ